MKHITKLTISLCLLLLITGSSALAQVRVQSPNNGLCVYFRWLYGECVAGNPQVLATMQMGGIVDCVAFAMTGVQQNCSWINELSPSARAEAEFYAELFPSDEIEQ